MRSQRRLLLPLVATLALVAAACSSDDSDTADATASEAASSAELLDFNADLLDGGEFDAASVEGTDTVLWFWAPWCTSCRAEAPDVLATAADFDGQVDLIGVAGRGEVGEMQDFVADTETGSLPHIIDAEGTIWSDFGVSAQPAFAFIDDSGEVEVFVGTLGAEGLTERMEALTAA